MVNSDTKSARKKVHKNYGHLREVYKDIKQDVKTEATQQLIEQLMEDTKFIKPPHVGLGFKFGF